ncbi:MAG: hypothetical protein GXO75_00035 [Calditrichaeota bacterium]|nr:hypothetical protein [Calditrichota bacterium]
MFQQLQSNVADVHPFPQSGWDGITIVGKYQFGIYHHYRLFNKRRLAKAIAAFIFKFNWNNSMPGQKDESESVLFSFQGSKNLSAGLAFHTDTAKYFRIHGHVNGTFPLSHERTRPAAIYHFHLSFLPARLGIRDLFYPFLGFAGMHYKGSGISPVAKSSLAFLTGMQSTWTYYPAYHTFIKFEFGAQLRAFTHPTGVLMGPAFALYFGTRFYFR